MKLKKSVYKIGAVSLILAATGFLAACGKTQNTADTTPKKTESVTQTAKPTSVDLVRVGVDSNFPPMVFRDSSGNWVGFDIELANEAFKRLGEEHDAVGVHWKSKEHELNEAKNIDVIWSGLNISPERRKVFDFSESYMSNRQVVVVLADSPIQTLADLSGKTVGTQEGSSLIPKLKALGDVTVKDIYPEYSAELVALAAGEIDATAMGEVAAQHYLTNTPGMYRLLAEDLGTTQMAVAVRKGDQEMLGKINKIIAEMKADGTVAKIKAKWVK